MNTGETVTFAAAATGAESYQWQYSNNGGSAWAKCSGTEATLSLKTSSAMNGLLYRCVVTNAYGSVTTNAVTLTVTTPPSNDETIALGQLIADFAVQFVGYDYVYGGDSPEEGGFDCSGLVTYVYAQFGYYLEHGSNSQYHKYGVEVAYEDMLPGDLVFFSYDGGYDIAHVGIYLGNDQMVHAEDYGVGVIISDLTSDWYQSFYYASKRIVLPEE